MLTRLLPLYLLTLALLPTYSYAGPVESFVDTVIDSPLTDKAMRNAGQDPDSKEGRLAKELARDGMGTGDPSNMKQRIEEYNESKSRSRQSSRRSGSKRTHFKGGDQRADFVEVIKDTFYFIDEDLSRLDWVKQIIDTFPNLNWSYKDRPLLFYAGHQLTAIYMMEKGAKCNFRVADRFVSRSWGKALQYALGHDPQFDANPNGRAMQGLMRDSSRSPGSYMALRDAGVFPTSASLRKDLNWFLKTAALTSDPEVVLECLALGADPTDRRPYYHPTQLVSEKGYLKTPLMFIAEKSQGGTEEIMDAMIEAGANPHEFHLGKRRANGFFMGTRERLSLLDHSSEANMALVEDKYATGEMRTNRFVNSYIVPLFAAQKGLLSYIIALVTAAAICSVKGLHYKFKIALVVAYISWMGTLKGLFLNTLISVLIVLVIAIAVAVLSWRKMIPEWKK